jgi:hypothetical protein
MKKVLIVLMMGVVIGFYSQLAFAEEIYKWVDEKGTTHFSDRPPAETVKSSVNSGNAATRKGDELARQRILKEAAQPNLKLPETSYYDAHPEEKNRSNVTLKKPVDIERKLRQMKNAQQQAIFDTESKMRNMQDEMERKINSQKSEMMFQKMEIENQIRMNNGQ